MKRVELIRARITKVAQRETGVGNGAMRIPGMKIGAQMTPGGPDYEDIVWLCDKVEMLAMFAKTATYTEKKDMHVATKLVLDIEQGR